MRPSPTPPSLSPSRPARGARQADPGEALAAALRAWEAHRRASGRFNRAAVWMVSSFAASIVALTAFPRRAGNGASAVAGVIAIFGILVPIVVALACALVSALATMRLRRAARRVDLAAAPVPPLAAGEAIGRLVVLVHEGGVLHLSRPGRRASLRALKWLSCIGAAAAATAALVAVVLAAHAGKPARGLKAALGGVAAAVFGLGWALARSPFQWIAEPAESGETRLLLEAVSIRGVFADEIPAAEIEGFLFIDGSLKARTRVGTHTLARLGKDPMAPWRAMRLACALAAVAGEGRGWSLHTEAAGEVALPPIAPES